jgi:hypothetical protein
VASGLFCPLLSAFYFLLSALLLWRRLVAADEPEGAEGEGQQEQRAGNQRRRFGNDRQHDSVNDRTSSGASDGDDVGGRQIQACAKYIPFSETCWIIE